MSTKRGYDWEVEQERIDAEQKKANQNEQAMMTAESRIMARYGQ
jgi:hypothetical protein